MPLTESTYNKNKRVSSSRKSNAKAKKKYENVWSESADKKANSRFGKTKSGIKSKAKNIKSKFSALKEAGIASAKKGAFVDRAAGRAIKGVGSAVRLGAKYAGPVATGLTVAMLAAGAGNAVYKGAKKKINEMKKKKTDY